MTRLPDPYATRAAGAGRSADWTASRLRGKAAQRWRRGAAGERQTAALLEPLRLAGWVVLHDRSVPGATANIDHLVCDGHTLWILDSKAWRGKVTRLGDGQLWYADAPAASRLEALRLLTQAAGAACRARATLRRLAVRATAVIGGASVERACESGVDFVVARDVLAHLSGGSALVEVPTALRSDLDRTFPDHRS